MAGLPAGTTPTQSKDASTGLQRAALAISAGDETRCLEELLSVLEQADPADALVGGTWRTELDVAAACCAELGARLGLSPAAQ